MKKHRSFESRPLTFNRQMLRASVSVTREKNTIHGITEVDITEPRKLIREYFELTGEKLSFTAYIVACLARVMKNFPEFNSFIKGKRLILMKDLTINVLVERNIGGEKMPEPVGIQKTQEKTYYQISEEIREAARQRSDNLGSGSIMAWLRFIPGFLLKTLVRLGDRNIRLAQKYGKVAVTAVGMFSKDPVWLIPHGSATVLLAVGSINNKVVKINENFESREHLCLTLSFDHDIIDGAPAARFVQNLLDMIKSGSEARKLLSEKPDK